MKPTVGRIVHFHQLHHATGEMRVLAAVVTKVNDDGTTNLYVFDDGWTYENGFRIKKSVETCPDGEVRNEYWAWPPREPTSVDLIETKAKTKSASKEA